jgi:hypothetical protein
VYFSGDTSVDNVSIRHTTNTTHEDNGYIYGGGIYFANDAAITRLKVSDTQNIVTGADSYIYGGGIYLSSEVSMDRSSVLRTWNEVGSDGGGASYIYGGGIYADIYDGSINRSTVGYTTAKAFGVDSYVYGGGLYFYADSGSYGLHITNSTFASNKARAEGADEGQGGAIYADGPVTLSNSTLDRNVADGYGSSVYTLDYLVAFHNTIVERGNLSDECYAAGTGSFQSAGFNLTDDSSCGLNKAGDRHIQDPKLGPLADYGGPTWTVSVLAGSKALNNGQDAGCPSIDQRGVHRPQGSHCDIGAYERKT